MNENINLCTILKGHEGKTFYSPRYGHLILDALSNEILYFTSPNFNSIIDVLPNGQLVEQSKISMVNEIEVFPSNIQRDWGKWDKENNNSPKTWAECCEDARVEQIAVTTDVIFDDNDKMIDNSDAVAKEGVNLSLAKSALAYLKISQIIEHGYGGVVEEISYHTAGITSNLNIVICEEFDEDFRLLKPLIFQNSQLANEFLSYEENKQLVKELYNNLSFR